MSWKTGQIWPGSSSRFSRTTTSVFWALREQAPQRCRCSHRRRRRLRLPSDANWETPTELLSRWKRMGKATGFLEHTRELPARRPVTERINDWFEIYIDYGD